MTFGRQASAAAGDPANCPVGSPTGSKLGVLATHRGKDGTTANFVTDPLDPDTDGD